MKSASTIGKKATAIGFTGLATLLILIPLLYNGTPLYYPDSMGYIFWGQQWKPIPERVSTYAAFIRAASLGKDLWFPVLLQSLIMVLVLKRIWKRVTGEQPSAFFLVVAALLGLLSPLGWTASTLMPDLFCVLSSLFLFFILFPDSGRKPSWYDFAGFVFCSSQHLSSILVNGSLMMVFVLWNFYQKNWNEALRIGFSVMAGLILSCLFIGGIHRSMGNSFFLSRSGPAFFTARLVETGVATRYLGQHKQEFPEFQAIKKSFPMSAEQFLWNPESPIHQMGGVKDTMGKMAAFNRSVFSEPLGLMLFVKAGIKSGIKQFFLLDLGDGIFTGYMDQILYYPENFAEVKTSKQTSSIDFAKLNTWCQVFFLLVLVFFVFNTRPENVSPEMKKLAIFILLLLVVNAFINGALSTPLNRYQVRVSWLVYFWLLAGIYQSQRSNGTFIFRSINT